MNSPFRSVWGVSLAVVVAGCVSPEAEQGVGQSSGQRSSPKGPVNLADAPMAGPQSGIQLGDEGSDSPIPACHPGELRDLSAQARGNPLSAGEWLDSMHTVQVGRSRVRIAREQSCSVELDYELQLDPSDARVWLLPLGNEVQNGECTSPEEYRARDVHLKLFIEGRLALAADVDASSDAVLGVTRLGHWPQGHWEDQFEDVAEQTLLELQDRCVPESSNNSDAGRSNAELVDAGLVDADALDGGDDGQHVEADGLSDGGLEVPHCTTGLLPDASVAPVLPDCARCLAGYCGEPDCKSDATCNTYLECLNACSGDTACLRDCGDPDCPTGNEASCYLLDCRNWGTCSLACGYGRECDPWESGPPSARIMELALSRALTGARESTRYEGYVNAHDFQFQLLP